MVQRQRFVDAWPELAADLSAFIDSNQVRPELSLSAAPAPARLATHTSAVLADVTRGDTEIADGRLVVLYEPEYQEAWEGHLRLVGYVRADLETEMVMDPLLLEVGWDWATEALERRGLQATAVSGTVSRNSSQSFGDIAGRPAEGNIEIRMSWTATDINQLQDHLAAWCDLLASTAGLEPLPAGVSALRRPGRS